LSAQPLAFLFAALLLCGSLDAHGQTTLPDGAGKEILQSACTGCHEIGRVLRAGYSAQDWRTVLHMMRNVGAQLPDDQLGTLVTYLAENFPEKAKPESAIVPGPAQVTFREWALPTPGSPPA
jgi:virginiamycin B lyase